MVVLIVYTVGCLLSAVVYIQLVRKPQIFEFVFLTLLSWLGLYFIVWIPFMDEDQ